MKIELLNYFYLLSHHNLRKQYVIVLLSKKIDIQIINWKKPFILHYEVETESFVDSVPFNEGAERLAYYLYDDKLKMNFVAKRKRIYSDSTNTIEFLSKDLESITICHHISNEFNDRIVKIITNFFRLKIFF